MVFQRVDPPVDAAYVAATQILTLCNVDEARNYLLQDLWYSQGLSAYAYVEGAVAAPYDDPRGNLTGDPYFTDGLRAVMWVSGEPLDMEEVRYVDWEQPPAR